MLLSASITCIVVPYMTRSFRILFQALRHLSLKNTLAQIFLYFSELEDYIALTSPRL